MPLGLLMGLARAARRKRTSSLDILSSKRAPRNYYKGRIASPPVFIPAKVSSVSSPLSNCLNWFAVVLIL